MKISSIAPVLSSTPRALPAPVPETPILDRFVSKLAAPGLPATPTFAAESIPDARGIAGDFKLRYVDLNKKISTSCCSFGESFQKIVDPGFDGKSNVIPS